MPRIIYSFLMLRVLLIVSKSSHTHYLNLSCGHIATFLAPSDERKHMLLMRRMRTTGGNYFHPRSVLFFNEKLSISFLFRLRKVSEESRFIAAVFL